MLHPRYPIETARLHLRPLVEADFEDFYAYDSMPEVARYLYWEPRGETESREAFERHCEGRHWSARAMLWYSGLSGER